MTLLLSYLIFTKPLTEQHGSGLLLITMGILLKMLPENKPPPKKPSTSNSQQNIEVVSHNQDNRFQVGIEEDEEERRPLV